jgi:hypothetical protein
MRRSTTKTPKLGGRRAQESSGELKKETLVEKGFIALADSLALDSGSSPA